LTSLSCGAWGLGSKVRLAEARVCPSGEKVRELLQEVPKVFDGDHPTALVAVLSVVQLASADEVPDGRLIHTEKAGSILRGQSRGRQCPND
jgi:hypothetical protein